MIFHFQFCTLKKLALVFCFSENGDSVRCDIFLDQVLPIFCGLHRDMGGGERGGVHWLRSRFHWARNLTLAQCPSPLKIIIGFQWTVRKPDKMLQGGEGGMGKATYHKLTSYPRSVTCWGQASYQGEVTTCCGVVSHLGREEGGNVTSPLMLQIVGY